MENKENIVARMVDSKFFMPIIIVFLAFTAYYLWADIKAYRDLKQEDFNAYIKMVEQRESQLPPPKPLAFEVEACKSLS